MEALTVYVPGRMLITEKYPSALVALPIVSSSMMTFTPMSGSPVSASIIVPSSRPDCARMFPTVTSRNNTITVERRSTDAIISDRICT